MVRPGFVRRSVKLERLDNASPVVAVVSCAPLHLGPLSLARTAWRIPKKGETVLQKRLFGHDKYCILIRRRVYSPNRRRCAHPTMFTPNSAQIFKEKPTEIPVKAATEKHFTKASSLFNPFNVDGSTTAAHNPIASVAIRKRRPLAISLSEFKSTTRSNSCHAAKPSTALLLSVTLATAPGLLVGGICMLTL